MGMGDNAGIEGDNDALTHFGVPSDDDESTDCSDVKDDNVSLISIAKSTKSTGGTKKRVQFLPDDFLVRIREIPPRSNKSSSESDGSASDTSDSEESDTESATDSEDVSSERDTPSPAPPTESHNKFETMPPLLYTAKGSYTISKQNSSSKPGNNTVAAKITGIDPATIPFSSFSSSNKKSSPKRTRRSPSPKFEKRTRRNSKNIENNKPSNRKVPHPKNNETTKTNKKRTPLKVKEGKISPPPPFVKQSKNVPTPKPINSVKLSQRRAGSAIDVKTNALPTKRVPKSTVTTSLTVLPSSSPTSFLPESSSSSLDRVSRAMQSLSMGKLYTVDGFIFPPHHAKDLHLPDLPAPTSKSEDFEISVSVSPSPSSSSYPVPTKRPSIDLGSPRRSYHDVLSNNGSTASHQTPPQSANRKRRHYAWQMANGSIQNALQSTPSISQLWESPGRSHSDPADKAFSHR